MYICVTSFIVNTLVWARLRSVINRDLISPPRQRRDTTPSGWKTERHPVICIKSFQVYCPAESDTSSSSFLWDAATEIAFKTAAILLGKVMTREQQCFLFMV